MIRLRARIHIGDATSRYKPAVVLIGRAKKCGAISRLPQEPRAGEGGARRRAARLASTPMRSRQTIGNLAACTHTFTCNWPGQSSTSDFATKRHATTTGRRVSSAIAVHDGFPRRCRAGARSLTGHE